MPAQAIRRITGRGYAVDRLGRLTNGRRTPGNPHHPKRRRGVGHAPSRSTSIVGKVLLFGSGLGSFARLARLPASPVIPPARCA